ncbi:MAG: protein kinase [Ruminococcus sp.]|nr:protein kinase [Ruminococcus sp.]MBP3380043.1 protein kinase [Ruminococcus sp.]
MPAVKNSAKEFVPYYVKGYCIRKPLQATNAGNCTWGYAEKFGKEFFIKQFITPKFPAPDADMYESTRKRMVAECEKWYHSHEVVYNAVLNCGGSNLISPMDFFLEKNTYFLITEKVTSSGVRFTDICKKSEKQQEIIMRVLAHEMACLAKSNIVHSDLKPENLILKETVNGFFTVKIIDFDAGFLSSSPPDPDDLTGDQIYFSPEMLVYFEEEEGEITPKSDVFALGILFHMILCGKMPEFDERYVCLAEALLNEEELIISPEIPASYRQLLRDMLTLQPDERITSEEVFQRLIAKDKKGAKKKSGLIIKMSGKGY